MGQIRRWRGGLVGLCAAGLAVVPAVAREAKACGHHDYPPWNWSDGREHIGSCIEVVRRAFAAAGLRVNFQYVGPWRRCQNLVESGEVEINVCAFRNPEREAYSVFLPVPMGYNDIVAFGRKAQPLRIAAPADLRGLRIGLVNGVSMGEAFDQLLASQTERDFANDAQSTFRKLPADRVDAVLYGREAGQLLIERLGLGAQLAVQSPALVRGELYISVSRQARWLLPYLPKVEAYLRRSAYPAELAHLQQQFHRQYLLSPQP